MSSVSSPGFQPKRARKLTTASRAQQNKQRIVLPESLEERTLTAADMSLRDGLADIILIGNPEEIHALGAKLGLKNLDKAEIIDPATSRSEEHTSELQSP